MISKFRGFLVSSFLGFNASWLRSFLVSWFLSFSVSWFLGFKVPKNYQVPMSCFLEAIDPIFQICRNLLDGSPIFVDTCVFLTFQNARFAFFEFSHNYILSKNEMGRS